VQKQKRRLPGFMSADEENWFEDVSTTELERLPTQEWDRLKALWIGLGISHPRDRWPARQKAKGQGRMVERVEVETAQSGQSYEEANWAKLSPMFRKSHNRLRIARGMSPIPEPKVDLWVPPRLRKVEKIDETNPEAVAAMKEYLRGGPGGWLRVTSAVRQRLLMHMLQLCSDRSDPPPPCLILGIENEWKKKHARNRSNTDSMAAAAGHLVRNPKTGSTAIGKLLKIKPTTIEGYFRRQEFWRICAEAARVYDNERALQVLETYIKKFGEKSTFDYASNETDNVPLSHLVPAMLDSLEGRTGTIKSEDVAAQRKQYDDSMQPEALKSRLWRASDHPVVPRGARA
jgi:hypothetical protein